MTCRTIWIFGVYFDGELYSSVRISVLTRNARRRRRSEVFGDILHPKLDGARSSSIPPVSSPIPDKASVSRNCPM